jgi:hypothetical protein
MARPDLTRSTKAVQTYIEVLEADLAATRQRLDALTGFGPEVEKSNTCVDVLEGGEMRLKALQNNQAIVFVLREGRHVHAQVQVESLTGIPRLVLWATNRYGSGMLAISPVASNKAEVFIDPKDEFENWSREAKKRTQG